MKHFVAIAHHDEGSSYGLTFPDVPGCFAASDDLDGLVAAGAEALGLFFDDASEVPEPRDAGELQVVIKDAIMDGAFTSVLIPYVGRSGRVERVNISLDAAVLAAIDREAESRKLTRSAFLAVAAIGEIEQRPATTSDPSRTFKGTLKAGKLPSGERSSETTAAGNTLGSGRAKDRASKFGSAGRQGSA